MNSINHRCSRPFRSLNHTSHTFTASYVHGLFAYILQKTGLDVNLEERTYV